MITIIEGISEDFDEKKILRAWKKVEIFFNFFFNYIN